MTERIPQFILRYFHHKGLVLIVDQMRLKQLEDKSYASITKTQKTSYGIISI